MTTIEERLSEIERRLSKLEENLEYLAMSHYGCSSVEEVNALRAPPPPGPMPKEMVI